MSKPPPKSTRKENPAHASATKPVHTGSEAQQAAKAPQKPGARHSYEVKAAKDDWASAVEVLARKGIALNDPRVRGHLGFGGLMHIYDGAREETAHEAALAGNVCAMYEAAVQAVENVRFVGTPLAQKESEPRRSEFLRAIREQFTLTSDLGSKVRAYVPLSLEDEKAARKAGLPVPFGRIVLPNPKAGHGPHAPVAVEIDETLRYARNVLKWDWQECAAIVFLVGADKRSYAAIRKSFRDRARMMKAGR